MKKMAALLIIIGSGLAAVGISGLGWRIDAGLSSFTGDPNAIVGFHVWSPDERLEIIVGVLLLTGGLILRKDSK